MQSRKWIVFLILLMIAMSVNCQVTFSDLKGNWRYSSYEGNLDLIFQTENQLIFAGEAANYSLVQGAIRVQDEYYPVDYPYTLQGNTLNLSFPEGYQLAFIRVDAGNVTGTQQDQNVDRQSGQAQQNRSGGQEYQLQGKLCSYSGSSTYSSSYSSTKWAYFDGQGNFQYGSESSFSSDAGSAYSGDNSGNRGTYRVSGDIVTLIYSDGSSDPAKVYMRQNDGRITELKYGEELYATGLCE